MESSDSREALKTFLIKQLDRLENQDPPFSDFSATGLLIEAIEGLEALDGGEVRPIFAPVKKRAWGQMPFTAGELQRKAVEHIAIWREAGCSAADAFERTAKSYLVDVETMRKWWKQIGEGGNPSG